MNQARICAAVVLLCVICPLMVGYAWPVSEGTETIYTVDKTRNVTQDFVNGNVDVFAEFTDAYANNMNIYSEYGSAGQFMSAQPADLTLNNTGLPAINPYGNYVMTYTANQDPYEISDLDSFIDMLDPHAGNVYGVVFMLGDWDEIDLDGTGGEVADSLIYYPESKVMQYLDTSHQWLQTTTATGITYCSTDGSYEINVQYLIEYTSPVHYADISEGFILYNDNQTFGVYNTWLNGYENSRVDILFKTFEDFYVMMKFSNPRVGGGFEVLNMYVDDTIKFYCNGETLTLGSVNDYPYILLRFDAANDEISLSGLPGMTSYTDPYESLIRKTVSMPHELDNIHYIEMKQGWYGGTHVTYYVPKTIANISSVQGINYSSQNISLYGNGTNYQATLKFVQKHPTDEFHNTYFGSMHFANATGHINKDNTVTWSYNNEVKATVPLDNMVMQVLGGTKVYVNGIPIYESLSYISDASLDFGRQWLVQIYYSDLNASTAPTYDWLPGGFGLDVSAYCVVGMITAFGAAAVGMLVGRHTGSKALAVVFVAAVCGVVYLIILMDGL